MDIVQLYQDYSVDFLTEGHKHCRPGWVNTPCPFCIGNPGYHLGYELDSNHYYCWRCGWHPTVETLSKLINISIPEVHKIIKSYGLIISRVKKEPTVRVKGKAHRMPSGTGPLQERHIQYLESRNFNAKELEHTWNLVGTGPTSALDGLSFKLRIIIPILWGGQAVSFTGRDITDKQALRYCVCPKERELIFHKHILYGRQDKWNNSCICVEGPTDVWRFGVHSVATFGIQYKAEQVRVLAKAFKRIAVAFDDDPQAILQAKKLVAELKFRGVDAFRVDIEGDPGSMEQNEADYLVKQLIK